MTKITSLRRRAASTDQGRIAATAGLLSAVPRRHRSRVLTGGLLLAVITAGAALAGPAALASSSPSPSPSARSSAPSGGSGSGLLAPRGQVRWSLVPASATTPYPGRLKFTYTNVQPGSTISDHVAIFNYSRQAASFEIYATDATGTTASNELLLMPAGQTPKDIGAWVSFGRVSRISVIIPADHGVIEPFAIKVPRPASPGDHTGGLVAAISTEVMNAQGKGVSKSYRIAIPLEMRIAGPLHPGMSVESISAGFNNTVNPVGQGSATISYVVHNSGNIRLDGSQSVKVTGPFGMTATIPPKVLATVLPGDSVEFTARTRGLYPAGPLTAHVTVLPAAPAGEPALTAPLAPQSGTASLFAVPWAAFLLILLVIGGAVGARQALRIRRRRMQEVVNAVAEKIRRETEQRMPRGQNTSAGTTSGQA
jgi:hypothetical protein